MEPQSGRAENIGSMSQIEHVVLLMLENRSLDSLLGWLYEKDRPLHNIPAVGPNERAYEGLQGLDLSKYVNVSDPVKQNIDMTLGGVLIAGGWNQGNVADRDDKQRRDAVIQQLVAHSKEQASSFRQKSDDELIGMAGAIIYLLGHGDRTLAQLKQMTPMDHRNTLIVVMKNIELAERPPGQAGDEQEITRRLQGVRLTKELVAQATREKAWLRIAVPPIRGADASNAPNYSPGESFLEVNRQHYGKEHLPDEEAQKQPAMKGFVKDYVHVLRERGCPEEKLSRYAPQVMQSYTAEQLPVLNGLARHYAVCDMWFSSVPSQTNCNRAFAFCGTSEGLVNNGYLEKDERAKPVEKAVGFKLGDDRFSSRTIFNALAEDGSTSWKIFYRCGLLQDNIARALNITGVRALLKLKFGLSDSELDYLVGMSDGSLGSMYSYRLFRELQKLPGAKGNCEEFGRFHELARAGKLPNFTFIEPVWSISPQSSGSTTFYNALYHLGDDYHPPCNLDGGENLVRSVYASLIANRDAWNKTLFIITFDEPVGSFDHVPPPNATPPWGSNKAPANLEEGFKFDRYGGRVPTLLISPLVEKGTVFRSTTGTPYDHTSLIATLLKWRGASHKTPEFGERTSGAPTFEAVLTRTEPRADASDVAFLKDSRRIGDVVNYRDRFCLRNDNGDYIAGFREEIAGGAVAGGALFEQDAALTEFFPTMSDDAAKRTQFYCVSSRDRTDVGPVIIREPVASPDGPGRPHVKILAREGGLGSYPILGAWSDSRDCYYSNDYVEGENDQKERWFISPPEHLSYSDDRLRYGFRVTIKNEYWWGRGFLQPNGEWVTTGSSESGWRVLPAGLRWTAGATGAQQGNWRELALSAGSGGLSGLEVVEQGGYGVINVRGLLGAQGGEATAWTSDDLDGRKVRSVSSRANDQVQTVQVKSQGDYGIIDVRFTTRMGYDSGWLMKNPETSGVVTRTAQAPDGAACAGVVGRKWAKHGLMDLQLAYY